MSNEDPLISDCGTQGVPEFADCFRAIRKPKADTRKTRRGSVYLAVLGTSLIVALLALSTLALQRVQNRMLTTTSDIRQAQLNAEAAVELGLLAMKQDTNWRTTYPSGHWFTDRSLAAGTCSLDGIDPVDNDLTDDTTEPVVLTGIGKSGASEQRVQVTIDPVTQPLTCLRSAVAVGHAVTLTNSVLRSSGPVAASSVSASSATIYGNVQGVSVTGSTYAGTSTQINTSQLPKMPTWTTVFDYYKTNGTQLDYSKLSTQMPNLAHNGTVEAAIGSNDWTGSPPGASVATVAQSNAQHHSSGSNSLKVSSRADWTAGAAQRIDNYVKPGSSYNVSCYVYVPSGVLQSFWITLCTKGTGGAAQSVNSAGAVALLGSWVSLSANLVAPSWSGNLEYAYVKIAGTSIISNGTFYVDDLTIRENSTGALIYQQTLGPSINTLYNGAPTNSRGIYWVDCGLGKLTIERSRIKGTLLVLNPGTNSGIGAGPVNWSPAVAGYPALLVHADNASNANFTIQATNRVLSEMENGVNFNPAGAPSDDFGQDTDTSEIYPSEIRGMVVVENNLTYLNNGLVRGALVVGNDLTSTSGSLEVAYQPDSLLNPPPGFNSANIYLRRPASAKKTVSP